MSRRRRPEKREILPDPKYGDQILSKFMNNLMLDGKKSVAESIVYGALSTMETRAKADPVQLFHNALENVRPQIEVRSRRVGGARAVGKDDVGAAFGRADGRVAEPRQCGQEARRHAPHGRRQPRVQPLPLVNRRRSRLGQVLRLS